MDGRWVVVVRHDVAARGERLAELVLGVDWIALGLENELAVGGQVGVRADDELEASGADPLSVEGAEDEAAGEVADDCQADGLEPVKVDEVAAAQELAHGFDGAAFVFGHCVVLSRGDRSMRCTRSTYTWGMARWTKTRSGEWAVAGPPHEIYEGAVVEVERRDGRSTTRVIEHVIEHRDGWAGTEALGHPRIPGYQRIREAFAELDRKLDADAA